ncbi:MAG TPA: amino acid adenylation domain-containing protein, partial [Pyrinomonadaceae bacterium]|nr:amino acid adenylation domain-containing protein [Pyrinomonadaceae bacterium]
GERSFRETLREEKRVCLEAYAHQDLPFEKLLEELHTGRDVSYQPLFQVMFVLQNAPPPTLRLPGLTSSVLDVDTGSSKFDLLLNMYESPKGLAGFFEYNTDLFDEATIARLEGHFQTLLRSIQANADERILDLPILTKADEQQLENWNATARDYTQEHSFVHQLFEAQARRTPEAIAMSFEGRALTYEELNVQANQLAHYLREHGIGADVLVGICMERSLEMLVAMLAVIKSGGAYVPFDPTYPEERLAFMLEDAAPTVMLTQERLKSHLEARCPKLICLDSDWETIARRKTENPSNVVTKDCLAYVIYTSGSTGRPKGIAMIHGSLFNLISWQLENTKLGVGAKTLQFASLSFDVSNHESFSTWGAGGTLVLIPDNVRRDVGSLHQFIVEQGINKMHLPFIVLQQLAEVSDGEGLLPVSLRELNTAGEQLQVTKTLSGFFRKLDCTLYNQYGPSECHVVSAYTLSGSPDEWPALPPIGRPIANTELYILDKHLQRVPIGVAGELYIGGESLARGYLKRPDVTADKFVPNHFSATPGARLYKTGDLTRYLADGRIEFLGRLDHQVKVRGFRIELGEIEAVLGEHPAVQEVVALAHGEGAQKNLAAYVVLLDGEERPRPSEWRQYLREKLPDYMIPSAFVILDALPITSNGKVDRKALPAPEPGKREIEVEFVAPQTPAEELVAEIWADVIGLEQVGLRDNFFELGGHSLLATQVVSRLRQIFRVEIPLRALFQMPTVEGIVEVLAQMWEGREIVEEIALTVREVEQLSAGEVDDLLSTN